MGKILIIGAARSGYAAMKYCLKRDISVVITDTRSYEDIKKEYLDIDEYIENKKVTALFGEQPPFSVLDGIDEMIVSPGVPLLIDIIQEGVSRGIPLVGELEYAFRNTKGSFVGVTGTNGKTTTTTLTGELFKAGGYPTYVVGNIGEPVINHISDSNEEDVFVTEVSSFQLETISDFHPHIAAILNITPDHLNRHITMDNYAYAKARIFENQTVDDYIVLNWDDFAVRAFGENANSSAYYFSIQDEIDQGGYYKDGTLYLKVDGQIYELCKKEELKIFGMHNVQNVLAASIMAYLGGVTDITVIKEVITSFGGVSHRLEFVARIKDVMYINDSKGTNTDATITALKAFDSPVILFLGGYDKKVSFEPLMPLIMEKVKKVFVIGQTRKQLIDTFEKYEYEKYEPIKDYHEGIKKAYEIAEAGDVVMLSPACASWGMFDNFEDRGNLFKKDVLALV
jgi:UDP-N-acetylmuramoylalanine--D-glutamate ligase